MAETMETWFVTEVLMIKVTQSGAGWGIPPTVNKFQLADRGCESLFVAGDNL